MRGASRLEKCVNLPRVFTFDLADPWEGLRVTPKMCHFYDAFSRIPSLDRVNPFQKSSGRANFVFSPRVQSLDQANPL